MLGRLAGHFNILQEYVVMSCFIKMHTRMKHRSFSLPYFDAIKGLRTFEFKETCLRPETNEKKMERTFGTALTALFGANRLKTSVTNLLALPKDSDELYTKDTCMEFHLLLCELLILFKASLDALKKLINPDRSSFDDTVREVVIYGEALQLMAGGVAIQRHFQVIENELTISHHKRTRDIANQTTTLPDVETEREHDIELQSVQPFAIRDGKALTMSKAANHWLKLMVVQFDATKLVNAHYDLTKMTKMTIKILEPPQPDDKMLSWKNLLRDENYIDLRIRKFNPFSSVDIIQFLEKHAESLGANKGTTTIEEMSTVVNKLLQSSSSEAVSLDGPQYMEIQLSGLREGMSPDQGEITRCISNKIQQLKNIDDEPSKSSDSESRRDLLYSIVEMLESLAKSTSFFKKLRQGSALSTGARFEGAPHCEVILAASIFMAKKPSSTWPEDSDALQELSVSHRFHILVINLTPGPYRMLDMS